MGFNLFAHPYSFKDNILILLHLEIKMCSNGAVQGIVNYLKAKYLATEDSDQTV